jgi:thiol-disulfide isomerase/thioredoxin
VPIGGWAVYGAAEFALDIMRHDLDSPAYRALFVAGLEARREAQVPWVMLNSFDQVYWQGAHPDESWLPERKPPARDSASITPLEVHQERRVAQVSPGDDSRLIFVTRPEPDQYVMIIEHPQADGSRTRGVMYEASTLYDAYAGLGQKVIVHFWNDPEFEPFCKYVAPKICPTSIADCATLGQA